MRPVGSKVLRPLVFGAVLVGLWVSSGVAGGAQEQDADTSGGGGLAVQRSIADTLANAEQAGQAGGWDEAIELYLQVRAANSNNFAALLGSAEAYFYLGRFQAALAAVNEALRNATGNREAQLLAARILIALDQPGPAGEYLQVLLRENPRDAQVLLATAELNLVEGRLESAVRTYERLRGIDPDNVVALLALALLAREQGDYVRATGLIEEAREAGPVNPVGHYIAARHYLQVNELQKAQDAIELATRLAPLDRESIVLATQVAARSGDLEGALRFSARLIALDVGNPRYWLLRGLVVAENGDYSGAIESLRRALRVQSDYEEARIAAEEIARAEFAIGGNVRQEFADWRFAQARSALEARQYGKAAELYRRGLQLAPLDSGARESYAELLLSQDFLARYLQELELTVDLQAREMSDAGDAGDTESDLSQDAQLLADKIESAESLLAGSVAQRWGVDQFTIPRDLTKAVVVVDVLQSDVDPYLLLPYIGSYFVGVLTAVERLEVHSEAIITVNGAPPFARLEEIGGDYFVLLQFDSVDRDIRIEGDVRVIGSGNPVGRVGVDIAGLDRWQRATGTIASRIEAMLPARGTVIARRAGVGIIDAGRAHGVAVGDTLEVVRRDALQGAEDKPALIYNADAGVGSVTITAVDDLIAEGDLQVGGIIDNISVGDEVIVAGGAQAVGGVSRRVVPLYDLVRQLR